MQSPRPPAAARFTRRSWAGLLAAATPAAQTPPAPSELPAARQRLEQNTAALRRIRLDPSVEPAFAFKP
jgi:hypothetical protein